MATNSASTAKNLPELSQEVVCFGGKMQTYQHVSQTCQSTMRFAVYLPPQAEQEPVPVVYFLSGLTCTEENFTIKAGAQRYAAELGVMLVMPDTSPRNTGIPGEDDEWDLGTGAGFYVDAIAAPWSSHYKMYSYVTEELPAIIAESFPSEPTRQSIMGHSMGGHGALLCAFKRPDLYQSVSAFAPICAPMSCPWGKKAFSAYLGSDQTLWQAYDASELAKSTAWQRPVLVDQGAADTFLEQKQLLPERLVAGCETSGIPLTLRMQKGYDHSYFFIASFIGEHLAFHAASLHQV